jgi:hypothetical protein
MSALIITGLLFFLLFSKLNGVHGIANSFSRLTKRDAFSVAKNLKKSLAF